MDSLLFTVAEKILINYPKDTLDNPLRQTLIENKLWSIAQPYYFIFLKKGLQTSGCISICRTAKLIVGGGTPPTAPRPGWCPHQPATN